MKNIFTIENISITFLTLISYYFVSKISNRVLQKHNNLVNVFLSKSIKVMIIVISIFTILSQYSQFEKLLSTLFTNSALLVAVIGFALQNTIKNVLAGMLLLSSDTFKVGDRIRVPEKSVTGEIEEMTLRHTVIKLVTNERAIIPNSIMNDSIVINNNIKEETTRYPLSIKVPTTMPIDIVYQIIEDVISCEDLIIHDDSNIMISHVEKDYVELKVLIQTRDLETSFNVISKLKFDIIRRIQSFETI